MIQLKLPMCAAITIVELHNMIKRSIGDLSAVTLSLFFAPQLAGCSVPNGNEPSAVYGALTSGSKTLAPPTTKGADLIGVIKDSKGLPVEGATVYVYTAKPRVGKSFYCPSCYADCGKHEVTKTGGTFCIPSMAKSLFFRILVVKDGFEPLFVRNVDPLKGEVKISLKQTTITPEQKKRMVSGRVLDPLNNPVIGAVVAPIAVMEPLGESFGAVPGLARLAITNQRGEFRFLSPRSGNAVRVRVSARGLATTNFAGLIAGSASPTSLDLPWGVTVMGTIRSYTGKPMAGVDIRAVPDVTRSVGNFTGWVDGTTNGAGKFTLYNVPANDEYTLCVKMDSLAKFNMVSALQKIRTRRNDTSIQDINMVVKPGAIIRGEVTLTDGKKLPSGTHMSLGRNEADDAQQIIVSSAGEFEFRGVP